MDPYDFATDGKPQPPSLSPEQPSSSPPQKRQIQIQGPRPAALKVRQESHKISKRPPLPPTQQHPVIIYAVSPKIIHAKESEFMTVVQRLTGLSSDDFSSGDGQVSPAARLAATEKASPRERNMTNSNNPNDGTGVDNDLMSIVDGVDIAQVPGILSPAPAMLPPVPPGFFSPITDPSFFIVSPSGLLSSASNLVSPLASPDIFSLLMDF